MILNFLLHISNFLDIFIVKIMIIIMIFKKNPSKSQYVIYKKLKKKSDFLILKKHRNQGESKILNRVFADI